MINKNWIALRGLVRGKGHWGRFPELLEQHFPDIKIHYLEIPGNGTRNQETTPTEPIEIINHLRNEFLKIPQPVSFLGISLGAMIGLKWAEIYPEDFQKIIVLNTSLPQLSIFYERLKPSAYSTILRSIFISDPIEREKQSLSIMSNLVEFTDPLVLAHSQFSKKYPVKLTNFFRQLILANKIKMDLHKLASKKNIIIGSSKQDRLVDFSCSLKLAQALKTEVQIHPSAGHDLSLDDPEWVMALIENLN